MKNVKLSAHNSHVGFTHKCCLCLRENSIYEKMTDKLFYIPLKATICKLWKSKMPFHGDVLGSETVNLSVKCIKRDWIQYWASLREKGNSLWYVCFSVSNHSDPQDRTVFLQHFSTRWSTQQSVCLSGDFMLLPPPAQRSFLTQHHCIILHKLTEVLFCIYLFFFFCTSWKKSQLIVCDTGPKTICHSL